VVGPIKEIALGFILRFLGFLGASRIPLNSINRLVNKKNKNKKKKKKKKKTKNKKEDGEEDDEEDTHALGEELTALRGSIFQVYSLSFILVL
jgi:hypothetical protein